MFKMVMGIEDELAFNHISNINQNILIDECVNTIVLMLVRKGNYYL